MDTAAGTSTNQHNGENGLGNEKKNRPKDSKFKQQKLAAWQPILTAGSVLPTFFLMGLVFIPLGVGLLITSNRVQEIAHDYTDCTNSAGIKCSAFIENNTVGPKPSCNCKINLTLTEDFEGQVYMYYGMNNFYQNHRRYVKSRNDMQLLGQPTLTTTDCDPFERADNKSSPLPYAPCGAIANSLFNDSIILLDRDEIAIALDKTGIAWSTDKARKYANPTPQCQDSYEANPTCWIKAFNGSQQPPYWQKPVYLLDPTSASNNGFQNEDLIVWMRTAALPAFRKLYRKVKREGGYQDGMRRGLYFLSITYNYPVTAFSGRKRVILSTASWMGAKNPFLGVAYIVVGSICIFLGLIFLIIHIKFGKALTEMADVRRT